MSTNHESPSPAPDSHDQTTAKGTIRDGTPAKEKAFGFLHVWRPHLIAKFQHAFLSHLLAHGEGSAHDLDEIPAPVGIKRVFIGAVLASLASHGLIRKAGPPTYSTRSGRHGGYIERWTLALDDAAVADWRRLHPIPPAPEPAEVEP
jgi:hypothetical protein